MVNWFICHQSTSLPIYQFTNHSADSSGGIFGEATASSSHLTWTLWALPLTYSSPSSLLREYNTETAICQINVQPQVVVTFAQTHTSKVTVTLMPQDFHALLAGLNP